MSTIKEKAFSGFIWRFLQNSASQIIGFFISIVLARILDPTDYGLVAMMNVFITISMVFINTGFNSAIIQKKKLADIDKDSMFYGGLTVSFVLYLCLFIGSPFIAEFYHEVVLEKMIRVEGLLIILGALYSVHQALITRELQFKKSFLISLSGVVAQGIVGILTAMIGWGAWALVAGSLSNSFVCMIVAWILVKWRPRLRFSFLSIKTMLGFSVKMLASSLLDTIFHNIRSLIIGNQYTSADLAYYNRGYQFPSLIMTQIDGSMTTVLFSSLSKFQGDWNRGLRALRRAMKTSMYVCAPLLAGMIAVARPMVLFLLTDKWSDSIIYVQLGALICLFWPLSARTHALNARGMSGISLITKVIGKTIQLIAIVISFRYGVLNLIIGTIIGSFLSLCINIVIYVKYLEYSFIDQIKDVIPSVFLATIMGFCVYWIQFINLPNILILLIQFCVGVAIYVGLSVIFKVDSFIYILNIVKGKIHLKKQNNIKIS